MYITCTHPDKLKTAHLHEASNLVKNYIRNTTRRFCSNCLLRENQFIPKIGNYDCEQLKFMYAKYEYRRLKHNINYCIIEQKILHC